MIVDRSALLGVLFAEPGRQRYPEAVGGRLRRGGEPGRHGSRADCGRRLDDLVRFSGVAIEPVTAEQARLARRAYRTYGRGSGSPARLNLGDCFAYALAKAASEPLLFKGEDFPHTDIEPALAPWGWPSIGRRRVRSFSAGALPSSPSVQRNGSAIVSPVILRPSCMSAVSSVSQPAWSAAATIRASSKPKPRSRASQRASWYAEIVDRGVDLRRAAAQAASSGKLKAHNPWSGATHGR